ncbi:MaoC family dehydratase [Micromonospora sp. SH-82]|uniref:MaoC family dehydratase n=1 Tax=Micromonospora sp. SH-82 TaxID=3132938 RepID=UPI003EBFE682
MRRLSGPDALPDLEGAELGTTGWREVGPAAVAAFAEVTGDRQWIHLDVVRAADGPFGVPVVHGLHLVAMVPSMVDEVLAVEGVDHVLNKGVERVRFAAPVPVGARVRGRVEVVSARVRPRGYWEAVHRVHVERDGIAEPVCAVSVTYLYRERDPRVR